MRGESCNPLDFLESVIFTGLDDSMPIELFIRLMDQVRLTDSESDAILAKGYLSNELQSASVIKEAKSWKMIKQQLLQLFGNRNGLDFLSCLHLQKSLIRKPEESLTTFMARVNFFVQSVESLSIILPHAWEKIFFIHGLSMTSRRMEQELDFLIEEMDNFFNEIELPTEPIMKNEVSDYDEEDNQTFRGIDEDITYQNDEEMDDEPVEKEKHIEDGMRSSGIPKKYMDITHESIKQVNWNKPLTYQRVKDGDANFNPLYVCAICVRDGKKEFIEGKKEFHDHIKKQHRKKMTACDLCDYSSKTVLYLARHRFKTHQVVTEGFKQKKCPVENCDFLYVSSLEWLSHNYLLHKGVKNLRSICPICGGSYLKYSLKAHIREVHETDKSSWHKCNICKKSFKSLHYLKKHLILHDNPDYFQVVCDLCGKVFQDSKRLNVHVRNFHNKEKSHSCPHCEKAFFSTGMLKNHIRGVHQLNRDHVCPHCGRGIANAHQLKIHINNHLKKKFYHCRLCDSWYTAGYTLAFHIAVRHLGFSQIEAKKKECISMARAHEAYERIKDVDTDTTSDIQQDQADLESQTGS